MSISSIASKVTSTVQNVANRVADTTKQVASSVKEKIEDKLSNSQDGASSSEDTVSISQQAKDLTSRAKKEKDDVVALNKELKEDGITDNKVTVNGTDGNDTIDITINKDGSYTVVVNGEESTYSSEEAQQLFIDGGEGDDIVNIHQEENISGILSRGVLPNDNLANSSKSGTTGDSATSSANSASSDVAKGGVGNDKVAIPQSGIVIDGGDGNDIITADDNVTENLYLTGGRGDDTISGGSGNDTIIDNYGSNNISGNAGDDTIYAMGRDSEQEGGIKGFFKRLFSSDKDTCSNTVDGGRGDDTIVTGNGNDIITDHHGNNIVVSNGGDDNIDLTQDYSASYKINTVVAGDGNDTIALGDGRDTVYGGNGDDTITATGGENRLYGEKGNDTIIGGSNRDYIEGGRGDDRIEGGGDNDVIYSGRGNDCVDGGDGDDFINAGRGDDEVHGGDGKDIIFGLAGDDKLYGDGGDDVIASGDGKDIIDGGEGEDKIRYTQGFFHGDDKVLNQEDGDDVQKLNPIYVPNNFRTSITSNQGFRDFISDNLEAFASIEPGQSMLTNYASTGHTITFKQMTEENGYASYMFGGAPKVSYDDDGNITDWQRGFGGNATVKLNPAFISFNDGSAWEDQNSMVIMAHEMSHAYNYAMGNADRNYYSDTDGSYRPDLSSKLDSDVAAQSGAVRGCEHQAVGIFDDSVIAPNPYGITENDYRDYFNMPLRENYL